MKVVCTVLLFTLVISGCSFRSFVDCFAVYEPDPGLSLTNVRTFGRDALTFDIKASSDLNWYDQNKHALTLAIFQLGSPNEFQQLVQSDFGIRYLLESDQLKNSFLSSQKLAIQPGTRRKVILDRMEGTTFIGVVGGFYEGSKQLQSRLVELPIVTKTKKNIPDILSWFMSFLSREKKFLAPAKMMVYLTLERDRIDHFSSNIVQSCVPVDHPDQSGYAKPSPSRVVPSGPPEDDISILEMI